MVVVALDTRVNALFQQVQNGTLSAEQASQQLLEDLVAFDGTVKMVAGVIEVGGITVCAVGSCGACALAVVGAAIGANTVSEGIAEVLTKEDQLSLLEVGLTKAGYSEAQAKHIKQLVERGVAVVTIVNGAIHIAHAGKNLAALDNIPPASLNRLTNNKICSFHGDTQVLTQTGYQAIRDLTSGKDQVWSRNAQTGVMAWKAIEAQYSNPYPSQVTVTLKHSGTGQQQQIISNRIHPYFVQLPADVTQAVPNSEGHDYQGVIERGAWVDAQHLQAGYRLLNADASWAEVVGVSISHEPLVAYNLTVADYHTYFVAGAMGAPAVWVHNDCNWKGFNPQKRDYIINGQQVRLSGLQYHYQKHGKEFGNITQNEYLKLAKEFGKKPLEASMQEARVNNFIVRHDSSTGEVFIGHAGKREMRTYYKDDGRSNAPFQDAVNMAGSM